MNIDNCFKEFYCKVNKISMAILAEESDISDFLFCFDLDYGKTSIVFANVNYFILQVTSMKC